MAPIRIEVDVESWALANAFVIARGSKTAADVVVVRAMCDGHVGRGECVPYARYGETVSSVVQQIRDAGEITTRAALGSRLDAGAARNALDCALWDLEAKRSGQAAGTLAGLGPLRPLQTAYTLSLGTPGDMAHEAKAASDKPLLKLKLGGNGDADRLRAVRDARPDARLVADANESWSADIYAHVAPLAAQLGVELIEQPFSANDDEALLTLPRPVPICADESAHTTTDLVRLKGRYDAVNIKLDKAGGLTEALAMAEAAQAQGFRIMAGCMVATSLAMAPAVLVAQRADWIDLDGPLLLAKDRPNGLRFEGSLVHPPTPALWG
jgi:L-alanine-DL-glutamate epimerase-like enolase superfamily enzyme